MESGMEGQTCWVDCAAELVHIETFVLHNFWGFQTLPGLFKQFIALVLCRVTRETAQMFISTLAWAC